MTAPRRDVWFWQTIVSPHMSSLCRVLAEQGHRVHVVATTLMSEDRSAQGWAAPELGAATLHVAGDGAEITNLVRQASPASTHVCQGIRSNGLVGQAQSQLAQRGLRYWIAMEMVDDAGGRAILRRLEYRRLFFLQRRRIAGILAIGAAAPAWIEGCGVPRDAIFPFAYFPERPITSGGATGATVRLLFVGQLIARKHPDLLLQALAAAREAGYTLTLVGAGPMEAALRAQGTALQDRIAFRGVRPMAEIPGEMAASDCLVLPSRHDGWGAVISEALMVGTPVICSDRCGAKAVVEASGAGGVFPSGDRAALTALLDRAIRQGPVQDEARERLKAWATCLGAEAGAAYLGAIFDHVEGRGPRPAPPWAMLPEDVS